jgi:hypothetical protein
MGDYFENLFQLLAIMAALISRPLLLERLWGLLPDEEIPAGFAANQSLLFKF